MNSFAALTSIPYLMSGITDYPMRDIFVTDHKRDTRPAIKVGVRTEPKIGRNSPCSCGSGKKYKKCCIKDY